ncbi:MAG: LytR C-terminal domain-containing protein [Candidatus Neomarinimicrobiota bacterium]|nr:LytR C-terminal domain-containing protein [Candidatus Neomarinimicrobiota bacterium]
MAKISPRKSSRFNLNRKKKSKVKKAKQMGIINAGIAVMSVLLFAFIFSFSNRQTQTGVPIKTVTFPSSNETPKLATEIYEANPVLDIEVEILNGCGEPGIAAKFSEFLRVKRVDVVRSENADNFDYENTVLIQRNEKTSGLKYVADALNFDIKNSKQVITSIDPNSDVDITLVIGKDFNSINSIKSYLNN